jgi:hypothetical protein
VSAPQPLTGDELAAIKARAERATPGPWEADLGSVWRPSPLSVTEIVCDCRGGEHITTREDAEHIAGMDPATTLRLVAEIERLRAQVEQAESVTGQRMMIGGHMATVIGERVIWDDDDAGVSR